MAGQVGTNRPSVCSGPLPRPTDGAHPSPGALGQSKLQVGHVAVRPLSTCSPCAPHASRRLQHARDGPESRRRRRLVPLAINLSPGHVGWPRLAQSPHAGPALAAFFYPLADGLNIRSGRCLPAWRQRRAKPTRRWPARDISAAQGLQCTVTEYCVGWLGWLLTMDAPKSAAAGAVSLARRLRRATGMPLASKTPARV